jgi:hypothetical protein
MCTVAVAGPMLWIPAKSRVPQVAQPEIYNITSTATKHTHAHAYAQTHNLSLFLCLSLFTSSSSSPQIPLQWIGMVPEKAPKLLT